MGVGGLGRGHDLLATGFRPAIGDVLGHGLAKQKRLLHDDADVAAQALELQVAHVVAVDQHTAAADVVETRDKIGDGRLARSCRPNEGNALARPGVKVDVGQDVQPVAVGEGDVLKGHVAADGG